MSIQEQLDKIRNAVYGREVRGSIAKGIETAYDDASEKHDNANMEVKIARGTHPNLRSRLEEVDNKQQQTNAQLTQKVGDGKQATMADLGQDVKTAMTGGSVAVVGENAVGTINLIDGSTDRTKLSKEYANNGRIFNTDDLNTLKKEGVYFKEPNASPANLPTELVEQSIFLEVRVYKKSSIVNNYLQRITPVNDPKTEYIRTFTDDTTPTPFIRNNPIRKNILTEVDVNKVLTNGQYLGLSTTEHIGIPPELVGKNFLLKVESFSSDERFVIQTIFQTAGEIQNTHKRMIQLDPEGNRVYDWKKDSSMLPSSGGGGEAYDQSLNTTDNVEFASVSAETIEVRGEIPIGTLSNPPEDVRSGDMWADTTDSETHPIVRVML